MRTSSARLALHTSVPRLRAVGIGQRESATVLAYAKANPAFPHESGADRTVSEEQFDSYRKLGFEIMGAVLRDAAENMDVIAAAEEATLDTARMEVVGDQQEDLVRTRPSRPSKTELGDLIEAMDETRVARALAILSPPIQDDNSAIGELKV